MTWPGDGSPDDDPPADYYVDVTPVLTAVLAQPTPAGRRIKLSGATSDGKILVGYGDADQNTGPIDVLGFDPGAGVVTTFLNDTATERLGRYRVFDDGSVWAVSEDPTGSSAGFLVTNRGGTWHSITVNIPGLTVPVHLEDVAEVDGVLYVSGSRDILPSENGDVRPEDEGAAIVWASDDGGTTWTEGLVNFGDGASMFNRFWDFGKVGDRLVVSTQPLAGTPQGYHVLRDGVWSARKSGPTFYSTTRLRVMWGDGFFFGAGPCAKWTLSGSDTLVAEPIAGGRFPLAVDGDRLVYSTDSGRIIDTAVGDVGRSFINVSACIAPDGRLYVSDGASIYRVDPPD